MPPEGLLGLTVNFRSQPAILDFTNALVGPTGALESRLQPGKARAKACTPAQSGLEDYEPLQAKRPQTSTGPCVEFLWTPREAREFASEARSHEADRIARRIAAMVRGGEQLVVEDRDRPTARLRPVRAGDVVLLFRAMSNVELYEAVLKQHGLDYY